MTSSKTMKSIGNEPIIVMAWIDEKESFKLTIYYNKQQFFLDEN